ncbi:hypothetical protein PCC7418_2035 [Halothece sp. PCC 7418]|nr:hypothetical protein [Halothece sp. PCC 7418]AFZ44199.1 hypothetical protein PCC7418_2035 [Halothece sp. PCC 7418]
MLESYPFNQITPKLRTSDGQEMIDQLIKQPLPVEIFTAVSREEPDEKY